jgi:virginiamycin B lyase
MPWTPLSEHARRTLIVPGAADFLALEGNDAWVTNEGRVEKLTPDSTSPVAAVPIPEPCGGMAVDFGSLWVADCKSRSLVRVDLESHRVTAVVASGLADPSGELSVATGAGSVWLLTDPRGVLSRVDPATNRVTARIPVRPGSFAAGFGFGSVWISNTGEATGKVGSVQRVDPARNEVVATIPVGPGPRFLAVGEGAVWTLNQGNGTVSRVDPELDRLAATIQAEVPGSGGDIAVGAGRVWVRATPILLSVVDPASNQVNVCYGPPSGSGAVRANQEVVWVTAHDIQTAWVLKP